MLINISALFLYIGMSSTMNQSFGSLGKRETNTSDTQPDRYMQSLRIWPLTFPLTSMYTRIFIYAISKFVDQTVIIKPARVFMYLTYRKNILIMIAGRFYTNLPMKTSHLVHGSSVLKSSILMTAVCAVEPLQVYICNHETLHKENERVCKL